MAVGSARSVDERTARARRPAAFPGRGGVAGSRTAGRASGRAVVMAKREPADGCRRAVAGSIVLAVAAIHIFRVGQWLSGKQYRLYYSYASDVLVPVAMYFVLCMSEGNLRFLRDWRRKAVLAFASASSTEVLQGLGVPMLGRPFDPLDFVMFGVGGFVAVLLDRMALPLVCRRWSVVAV